MRFTTVDVVGDHNLNLLGHRALLDIGPCTDWQVALLP
jgi:hypothetical protein